MTRKYHRRRFVQTIGAVGVAGALAGCGDDGDDGESGAGTATATETETETEQTETDGGDGGSGDISAAVDEANAIVEQVNSGGPDTDQSLESTNERLQNVDDIELVEPVEASSAEEAQQEAQRLRDEIERLHNDIRDKVPREINEVAPVTLIENPDELQTPEDFRNLAEEVPSQRAAEALNDAADGMERIEEALTMAAEALEQAAG